MIIKVFGAAVLALIAGSIIERARADETFVCPNGSLVTVRSGELATAKRTNACVARHFGLEPTAAVPLPTRKPDRIAIRKGRAPGARTRTATRYSMVRIINARAGEPQWYRPSK